MELEIRKMTLYKFRLSTKLIYLKMIEVIFFPNLQRRFFLIQV